MTTATPAVVPSTFTIVREYPHLPARVFAAFSSAEAKARWAACHEEYTLDFRVGGREVSRGGEPGGPVYATEALYHDIRSNTRVVYSYELRRDGVLVSVSVVCVEFESAIRTPGTRMVYTEQVLFLDGHDTLVQREHGTTVGIDRLAAVLNDLN